MSNHAPMSPSGFKSLSLCPGKRLACLDYPNKGNAASRQGTAAHELLERSFDEPSLLESNSYIDSFGITIDKENIDHVANTKQFILAYINQNCGDGYELFLEEKVDPYLLNSDGESVSYGTSDIIIVDKVNRQIIIMDYKNGHSYVNVEDNYQLLLYGYGAYRKYPNGIDTIVMGVLQPRDEHEDGPYRFSKISVKELETTWIPFFQQSVENSYSDNPERIPGEEQCHYCQDKGMCSVLANKALMDARASFKPVARTTTLDIEGNLTDPTSLSDESLKIVLDNDKLIRGWLDSVKELVIERIKSRNPVEGYKLVAGRKSRTFTSEESIKKFVTKSLLLADDCYERKFLSVAKMEKAIKLKASKDELISFKEYIKTNKGYPTLAKSTDKRESLYESVNEAFDDLDDELDYSVCD